jgi:hypothetical protein
MAQEQTLPTVAPIAPVQNQMPSNLDILNSMPQPQAPNVNPYMVQHDAQPVQLRPPQMYEQTPMTRPENQTSQARINNQTHNTTAAISNAIGAFLNKRKQEKFDDLKGDISVVMKAQQQIDNAQQVLQSIPQDAKDPQSVQVRQNAEQVIAQNKKVMEGKLDPSINKKTAKDIAKAFDISYTDPEKNNTPEVKAMRAAQKDVKAATQAGIDHNTPQEKAIAQVAANGTATPAQQQQQKAVAQVNAPKQSGTSYADQFLKSQPMSISGNPQYADQMKAYNKQQ